MKNLALKQTELRMRYARITSRKPYATPRKDALPVIKPVNIVEMPTCLVMDRQTPSELKQREIEANAKTWLLKKKLAEARPSGEKCDQKACPFPAVLEGKCRQHAMDQHAEASLLPSQMQVVADIAHVMGYWSQT